MFPMGMCVSSDIFQSKVDELHSDIEGVKTYIDDIMVLDKGFFYQDIDQLRIIFAGLYPGKKILCQVPLYHRYMS